MPLQWLLIVTEVVTMVINIRTFLTVEINENPWGCRSSNP